MHRAIPTSSRLSLACALSTITAPLQATTGLSSLEGLVWVFGFVALLGLAGLVVFVLYLRKFLIERQGEEGKPGWVLRLVTITLLLIATPLFLMAFSARELTAGWILTVVAYLALLAVVLIDFFGHKKLVLPALALVLPVYLIKVSGVVSFTAYTVVENKPFEPSHVLEQRLSGRYLRTTDGGLYRVKGGTLPRKDLLPDGVELYLEPYSDSPGERVYRLRSFGRSDEHYRYQRRVGDAWMTIPLRRISIDHYQTRHAGRVERIDGTPWRAEVRDMTAAAITTCCNADWFRELIEHGVDPRTVRIGERNLLHVLADDIHRHAGVVETAAVLIEAGIDIDARDAQGETPLHEAVDSFEYSYSQKPELAKRFTAYIQLLLESGADPNLVGKSRFSPILEAVISKRYEVARMLLQYGADPMLATNNNQTAYSRASRALEALEEDEKNEALELLVREMEAIKG